jgi:hypothetical protein
MKQDPCGQGEDDGAENEPESDQHERPSASEFAGTLHVIPEAD